MTIPALATPQYTKLRTPGYAGARSLSLFSNRVLLAGTIQTDLAATSAWAGFDYTATSGTYTDCLANNVLLIGTVNDISKATFRGRLRATPSSSAITCNESAQNFGIGSYFWVIYTRDVQYITSRPSSLDPTTAVELVNYSQTYQGLLPCVVGLQTAYVGWVDGTNYLRLGFDLSQSFAAESGASISSYLSSIDGAVLVAGSLSASIFIVDIPYGERWGLSTVTDSGGRALTRAYGIKVHDPVSHPPDTGFEGGSISASLEAGATLSIPAFAGVDDLLYNTFGIAWRSDEQYGKVSGGLYDANSAAVTNKVLTSNVATLTAAGHPFEVGVTVIVADVDSTFNGTHVITATAVNSFSFTKVHANVASAAASGMAVVNPVNVDFVGWFNREDDSLAGDVKRSVLSTAKFVFTGIGPRLARLTAQLVAMQQATSPTRWGEMVNATPWRAIWHFWSRYTTIATLCDITFDSTDNTYLFPEMSSQGGNALKACQDIASQIDAVVEFLPWGSIAVNRDVNWLTQDERDALTPFAAWTVDDAYGTPRQIDPNPNIGRADTDSATYNPDTDQVTFFAARAPGIAQGEAQGTATLPSQILAATTDASEGLAESEQRIGNKYNVENLKEFLDVDHPAGYVGVPIYPSRSRIATWVLQEVAGSNGVNRIDYDDTVLWTVETVTQDFNQSKGIFTDKVRYRRVADVGDPGDDITQQIPAAGALPALPFLGLPALNFQSPLVPDAGYLPSQINPAKLIPPKGRVALADGNTLLIWNDTVLELASNFINLVYPQTRNITPSGLAAYLIRSALFDPFNKGLASSSLSPRNNYGYALTSDGTNSKIKSSPNIFAPVPYYFQSNIVSGLYKLLRGTGTPGSLMAYAPQDSAGSTTYTDDFASGLGAKSNINNSIFPLSNPGADPAYVHSYSATGGHSNAGCITGTTNGALGNGQQKAAVAVDLGADYTITALSFWLTATATRTITGFVFAYDAAQNQTFVQGQNFSNVANVYQQFTPTVTPFTARYIVYAADIFNVSGTFYLDDLSVTYGGTVARVRVTTDYGITLGSAISAGISPGTTGGFDVQRAGANSFVAIKDGVARATTIGGTYNSYYSITGGTAQAVCIIVPYYNYAGALQTSATNPDIIIALSALDGSSRSLLWIEGGATAGTVHNITPVAGMTFDNMNCVTVLRSNKIAVFGLVSGVYKMYESQNTGSSWTLVGTLTTPQFLRDRRGDNSTGTNTGQLFLAGNGAHIQYSSKWASVAMATKTLNITPKGLDPLG